MYVYIHIYDIYQDNSGAPNGSVPQDICSYGISGWLARKGTDKFTFLTIHAKCYIFCLSNL